MVVRHADGIGLTIVVFKQEGTGDLGIGADGVVAVVGK
jgi:hypothetical protein